MQVTFLNYTIATLALGLASVSAHADIVNIDAQSTTGTTITLGAGTYLLSWAGIAGGGLYDAWTFSSPVPAVNGYRDAFTVSANGAVRTYDLATSAPFASFATAYDALNAFQTATSYVVYDVTGTPNTYAVDPTSPKSSPFKFTIDTTTAFTFTVPDYKFDDNSGGVSLSITAAVPEPETYALMLGGLGALAFVVRRRNSNAA